MLTFSSFLPFLILPCLIICIALVATIVAIVNRSNSENKRGNYNRSFTQHRHYTPSRNSYVEEQKSISGRVGELHVSSIIGESAFGRRYAFNDVLLKNGSRSAQIDHILVNRAGIFVIETKKISGQILGSVESDKWTQYKYDNIKGSFYNPIKQNETHIRFLKEIIGNQHPVYSLIVFANDNKPKITSKAVINLSELRSTIIEISLDNKLSSDDINNIATIIRNHTSHSDLERKRHIEMAKQAKDALDAGRCPRCKKKLVVKKGRFGEFWACSGYPTCNYTKDKGI